MDSIPPSSISDSIVSQLAYYRTLFSWQGMAFQIPPGWCIQELEGHWDKGHCLLFIRDSEKESRCEINWLGRKGQFTTAAANLEPLKKNLSEKIKDREASVQAMTLEEILNVSLSDSTAANTSLESWAGFGFRTTKLIQFVAFPCHGRLVQVMYHCKPEHDLLHPLAKMLAPMLCQVVDEQAKKQESLRWIKSGIGLELPKDYRIQRVAEKGQEVQWHFSRSGENLLFAWFPDSAEAIKKLGLKEFLKGFIETWTQDYQIEGWSDIVEGEPIRLHGVKRWNALLAPPMMELQCTFTADGLSFLAIIQAHKKGGQCVDSALASAKQIMGI